MVTRYLVELSDVDTGTGRVGSPSHSHPSVAVASGRQISFSTEAPAADDTRMLCAAFANHSVVSPSPSASGASATPPVKAALGLFQTLRESPIHTFAVLVVPAA